MATNWNPWHGCKKYSDGCKHCYVYRGDARHGKDASVVCKTGQFSLPLAKNRQGEYKIKGGSLVWTCFTSDFFLEEADSWREEAWSFMKERQDLRFFFITKRIHRFYDVIPKDWENGYPNVAIGCTMENQEWVDARLPLFKELPIQDKTIICEPFLEEISLLPYLDESFQEVVVGGESGMDARPCHYDWVLKIKEECAKKNVPFWFKQTGAKLVVDTKTYAIPRRYQHSQARKAGISNRRTDGF